MIQDTLSIARWDEHDVKEIPDMFCDNPAAIIFGFNMSHECLPGQNFHCSRFDKRLGKALTNVGLEGCMMADLYDIISSDMKVVKDKIKNDPHYQIQAFNWVNSLTSDVKPIFLVALGNDTYDYLRPLTQLPIVKIPHHSAWQIPDEEYINKVEETIEDFVESHSLLF